MRVKVTFYIDGDDPDHDMGVSTETYDQVSNAVMMVGGEDPKFEKVPDEGGAAA